MNPSTTDPATPLPSQSVLPLSEAEKAALFADLASWVAVTPALPRTDDEKKLPKAT